MLPTEEEFETEIEQTDICNEDISFTVAEIEGALLKLNVSEILWVMELVSGPASETTKTAVVGRETTLQPPSLSLEDVDLSMESRHTHVSKVKLPKLSFKKFGVRHHILFNIFWGLFKSAVHCNDYGEI